ncbi:hypothetical protein CDD81_5053 [Ophiocordyceps australis]|uniref:Uncharacterized protein n=1 Tax=Ophiocordyceps australis TaxID=1399860 RepID=A0A2C5Y9E0_9HYPO|nr:hypothetical protein CDD81_5053 [Ophiocordyceps australis]
MDARQDMTSLQREVAAPYAGPAGRAIPPRPSTASGTRQQPRRMQTMDPEGPSAYGSHGSEPMPSSDDVFNSYFDNAPGPGTSGQAFPPHQGAHQMPRLHHAKSEATFREPQAAVFEMAGDIPSVPPMPHTKLYQPQFAEGYGGAGYQAVKPPPRGPSAPPGAANGHQRDDYTGSDGLSRTKTSLSQNSSTNADALPSHPTPVRPGLVSNSGPKLNDRPPPVRNYGGVPQSGPMRTQVMAPQQQQFQRPFARMGHDVSEGGAPSDPVTTQELEALRMAIKANPADQESALRLARRLIEASDVLVSKAPDVKHRNKMRDRYLMDAHKILKKLANAQNQDAMFAMADGLGKGLFGHEPDNKEAFTLYQSAAKMGHAAAAYRTAVCCEIGHEEGGGTRKDPLKAMQWYKRAATLGDPPAMYKVGMILLKGLLGQPKNPREAVGWLKRAAERADTENPHALHELGLLYESAQPNDAMIRDERYALTLFLQAADLGYKFSQFRLGCAFEYGLMGCPIDPRQSIYWYSKAATQEEHQSELALSGWYLTGSEGVLGQSDTEAYLWARKAAVAGLAKAEYAMGYFTEVGIGVAANLEDAKRWYWRAAAQDFPKARERLEDLKRAGKNGRPRQRERISRSRIEKQQEGECSIM